MSIEVQNMVWDRYPGGGSELLLAVKLADHCDDRGCNIYPSVERLAQKTRQSERTVQRQLLKMQAMGWLVLVGCEGGGRGLARRYRINPRWIAGDNLSPFSDDELNGSDPVDNFPKGDILSTANGVKRVTPETQKGDIAVARKGDIAVSPQPSGIIRNHKTPQPPERGASGFDAIWLRYPRHEAEAAARRTWKRLKPDTAFQERILAAIDVAAATPRWQEEGGRFVPLLSKWLRGQRWLDEVGADSPLPPNWWMSREGVEQMGERLGMPFSLAALGNAYTEDERSAHVRSYRRAVFAAAGAGPWTGTAGPFKFDSTGNK